MKYFTEENSVEAVNVRMGENVQPRLRQVLTSLVTHLHAFAKDVELQQDEWEFAIDFLTKTGQISGDAISNRRPSGATENTVMGPFHVAGAPVRAMGDNICLDGKGESCLFTGRVVDIHGKPIEGARVDVWSDNAEGFYSVQQPGIQDKWNNRGIFVTGPDGKYEFRGIKPVSYPIPDDGPVGKMLGALGRHPNRPAHMHFLVTAPGYQKLVTHTFVGDDPWITSDAVFGVKSTLVAPFDPVEGGDTKWRSPFDFVMAPL
jgi:protocatechuate 3,4-dioxygenase beta subunit